jgi:hypothetical protein
MKMQRSAHRPCLHQRPAHPQRRPDIHLPNPVNPVTELKLSRRLNLRMHPAKSTSYLNKLITTRTINKARTRQTTRPHPIPTNLTHRQRSCQRPTNRRHPRDRSGVIPKHWPSRELLHPNPLHPIG